MSDQEPPVGTGTDQGMPVTAVPHDDSAGAPQTGRPSTERERAAAAGSRTAPRPTAAGRVWLALGVAAIVLILLVIFIAENSRTVTISFLGANGHISLALAMLISAVAGILICLLVGTARILQLRLEVRRHAKRANKRQASVPRG